MTHLFRTNGTMQIGALAESFTVTGGAAVIATDTHAVSFKLIF